MRVDIDTEEFSRSTRLARWREMLCDLYVGLDCEFRDEDFRVVVAAHTVELASISRITSSRHVVERSSTLIRRDGEELMFFGLVLEGRIGVAQGGREAVVGRNDLAILDSTRPYRIDLDTSDICWLAMPKPLVTRRLGARVEDLTAVAFAQATPIRRLATTFLRGLDAALEAACSAEITAKLLSQTMELMAMAVEAEPLPARLRQ